MDVPPNFVGGVASAVVIYSLCPRMMKRVNLGDASTWATRAVAEAKGVAKVEEVQNSQKTGKITYAKTRTQANVLRQIF